VYVILDALCRREPKTDWQTSLGMLVKMQMLWMNRCGRTRKALTVRREKKKTH
jgi:hypothetical protein